MLRGQAFLAAAWAEHFYDLLFTALNRDIRLFPLIIAHYLWRKIHFHTLHKLKFNNCEQRPIWVFQKKKSLDSSYEDLAAYLADYSAFSITRYGIQQPDIRLAILVSSIQSDTVPGVKRPDYLVAYIRPGIRCIPITLRSVSRLMTQNFPKIFQKSWADLRNTGTSNNIT